MTKLRRFVNGKWIYGAAAQQNIIKSNGGWNEHHKKIIQNAIAEFAENHVEKLNENFNRPNLKAVK
ncbi:hypothetical protein P9B03_02215 [Metasolibacillus meyeri]|uniref:Uncharacterized protein n=1 Tax=Metasolibacillus meyeri TaxID=1071052 RepID=A0AAW9NR99_9BACL|nr:hypothetical protein [Metasolibacillus meyeri]MEC1177286.1 hypothetical protein [Metasolibacillus meyeri]